VAEQIKRIAASPEMLESTLEQARQQAEAEPDDHATMGVTHAQLAAALAEFNRLWDTLTSGEKTRVLSLLVERVTYDGVAGQVSITFRPAGLQSLGGELASRKEVAA